MKGVGGGHSAATSDLEARPKASSETRFARIKRLLTGSRPSPQAAEEATNQKNNNNSSSNNGSNNGSSKARKRKERHESTGSLSQERKVIRSNSEERAEAKQALRPTDIRRVSSHEDFKKTPESGKPMANNNIHGSKHTDMTSPSRVSPHRDPKGDFLENEECEHEKRRHTERFSKPLLPRSRKNNSSGGGGGSGGGGRRRNKHHRCYLMKGHLKESDLSRLQISGSEEVVDHRPEPAFLQLHPVEKDRSPSPVSAPPTPMALDLSTLHEQIDCSEPIRSMSTWSFADQPMPMSPSATRMLASPRNSLIMTRRMYMDPDVPMTNNRLVEELQSPSEQRARTIARQINAAKKKISAFEQEFEARTGYRPSHADKLADASVKRHCAELAKLRKEQKELKEDPISIFHNKANAEKGLQQRALQLKESLEEVERRLSEKRASTSRTDIIEEMSLEQLVEEKVAVQKSLLHLESIYGRPVCKEDRDLVRPLYDRYRVLKRLVVRSGMAKMANSNNELATIHEHETMDFVSGPSLSLDSDLGDKATVCASTDSDTDTSIGENLHSLPLDELIDHQKAVTEEKRRLRHLLKDFENDFQARTGKRIQREDRAPMETVYVSYKQAKGKLRLLDALVAKHLN